MFIRIKKRKSKKSELIYDAVLVESYRNENQQPRQRYLKHLASIYHSSINYDSYLIFFYKKIHLKLKEYGLNSKRNLKRV